MSNGISVDTKGNVHVDDVFLQKYVENGGQAQTTSGTPVNKDNVDTLLNEVGKDHKSSTKKTEELHDKVDRQKRLEEIRAKREEERKAKDQERRDREAKREEERQSKDQERRDEKAKREEERELEKQQRAEKEQDKLEKQELANAEKAKKEKFSRVKKGIEAGKKAVDPVIKSAGRSVDQISRVRTVGGIGLLLAVLIFLLFIVVEVNKNGDTRIKQLWYMLNGRAALVGRKFVKHYSKAGTSDNTDYTAQSAQDTLNIGNDVLQGNVGGIITDTGALISDSAKSIPQNISGIFQDIGGYFQTFRTGF